jgi:hypothetical protein
MAPTWICSFLTYSAVVLCAAQGPSVFPGDLAVPTASRAAAPQPASEDLAPLVRGHGTGGGDLSEREPNDSAATGNDAIDLPFQRFGSIANPGDADFFRVNIAEGQRIEADAFNTIGLFNSPLDPLLVVRGDDGSVIAYNDNWSVPSNLSSHVIFVAPYSGTFSFEVRSAVPDAGPHYFYILSVWPVTGEVFSTDNVELEPNDERAQAHPLDLPGIRIGNISSPDDADWLSLYAPRRCTLVVDLSSSSYILPLDAVVELYDEDGARLWIEDDVDGRDPRFNIVLPERGTYYLKVTSRRRAAGPLYAYLLSVSLQDDAGSPHITRLSVAEGSLLRRIEGAGFDARGATVEVAAGAVQGYPSFRRPTAILKVMPYAQVTAGSLVTVCNPDGRRSNPVRVS